MPTFSNLYIHRILPTTASKPQKRTQYRNIRFMANNEVPSSKLARKRQSKTARPKVTVAAGIANVAASLSSFCNPAAYGCCTKPSYLVVALPICVSGLCSSTTQPSLSFTLLHLMSALQEPVPGSAQFSSPSHVLLLLCHQCRLFNCLCLGLPHFHLLHNSV